MLLFKSADGDKIHIDFIGDCKEGMFSKAMLYDENKFPIDKVCDVRRLTSFLPKLGTKFSLLYVNYLNKRYYDVEQVRMYFDCWERIISDK